MRVRSAQCLRAGGRYWAQAETELCSPAQLWSKAAKKRPKQKPEHQTQSEPLRRFRFRSHTSYEEIILWKSHLYTSRPVTYDRILVTLVQEEPVMLLDQVLHYLALVWHVIDHVGHVVLRRSDQCGTKHDRQVTRLHLERPC